ncbi:phage tail protein [Variovorax sp. GB1P17]|uniref:phage tail protein n=1 Tax=Variovorax sp. GB1P17 TaxID=3443740 RepID=UPI003F4817BD
MFEAYSVGITLKLHNLVSPQLALLAREFEKLEALSVTLKSTLRRVGEESAGLRAVAKAGNASAAALERASRSAAGLQHHMAALRATSATMPHLGPALGGGGGAAGAAAAGAAAAGARARQHGLHGGNVHMGPGGIGIGSVGFAAGGAILPLAMTAAMLYGGHSMYESAKALDTEKARFRILGMSTDLNNEAMKFVKDMRVYGTTRTENMKQFREAQGIFRESGLDGSAALAGAKLAAPVLAKIAFATESLDEEAKTRMRSSSLAMLRWVEMSGGLKSPQKFNELADLGWKLTQTSGGNVNWESLRQFSAISGNAGRFITAEGLAALEPIIGELKGSGAGTGLRTALNRITGIVKIPNQVAHSLVENGIWDGSKVEWNKAGGIKKFNGNPFGGYDEFVKDPASWYAKVMIPLYDKQKLSAEERGRSNSMLFGGTGGRLFTLIEQQMPTIRHSVEATHKAMGIDKSTEEAKKTLAGKEREFIASWNDFKTTFSEGALPAFSNLLTNAAGMLRSIAGFMEKPGLKSFMDAYRNPGDFYKGLFGLDKKGDDTPGAPSGGFGTNGGGAAFGNPNIRGAGPQMVQVDSTLVLDGKAIGKAVSTYQAKEMNRPSVGPRTADGRQSLRAFDLATGG